MANYLVWAYTAKAAYWVLKWEFSGRSPFGFKLLKLDKALAQFNHIVSRAFVLEVVMNSPVHKVIETVNIMYQIQLSMLTKEITGCQEILFLFSHYFYHLKALIDLN